MAGYGKDPFGTGPYGGLGGVVVPPSNPPLAGYGGASYGLSSYGSLGSYGTPIAPILGGYGGCAYGLGPYGCVDSLSGPPEVIAAVSITGFIVEVFFSQEMSPDADLFDPASYVFTTLAGAAATTVLNVEVGVEGVWGPTSVLLHHTGTTLGGSYRLTVSGPRDIGGTPLAAYAPLNEAEFLARGEPPPFTITPISGNELLYEFEYNMLDEASFSPGILQLDAYGYETAYPVDLIPVTVEHPYAGDAKQVKVEVLGMTSTEYQGVVSPATAIEFDGTYLPSSSTDFTGQSIGNGTSVPGENGLLLNTSVGFSYGWRFIDTSGKLLPDSSYRADITFDVTSATLTPVLHDGDFLLMVVNDGDVQVLLTLKRLGGIDTLQVSSGAFDASGSVSWSSGATTVSVVRNQKAETYTVVVNGDPFVSGPLASFTGAPSFPNGCQILVDPTGAYDVQNFLLKSVLLTATQTVFSEAWNFLHNQEAPFVGDATNTKSFVLTGCGPLVKGWGDATPATKQDVAVYVNGVSIEIEKVNPYIGKIYPVIPIPLMPAGELEVTVDYTWFPNPVVEFAGLNTEGLVLNQVANRPNCNQRVIGTGWSSGSLLPGGGKSSPAGYRFPMTVVIGSRQTEKPLLRSPRFIGFQKAYTAALNSPTTLLLNRDPHRVSLPPESKVTEGEVVFYDGTTDPQDADPSWSLFGVNTQAFRVDSIGEVTQIELPEGVFPIEDLSSGSYNFGQSAFYYRETDTSFPSTILEVSRFFIDTEATDNDGALIFEPDGVFTGVAFGAHTNNHLYVVGALLINDVQHIGILIDPALPEQRESWELAYGVSLQIVDNATFLVKTSELPEYLQGDYLCEISFRFQIFEDPQAGIYTVTAVRHRSDGYSQLTLDPGQLFPGNPQLWGGAFFRGYFESPWDGGKNRTPTTYRLIIKNDVKKVPQGEAELFIGGALKGQALYLKGAPPFAIPPDGVLQFPTGTKGQVFFGSISRRATSLSLWSFSHYGVEPASTSLNFRGIVAAAEMNDLPEDDPNNIWFLTQDFGVREIDSTGDRLLLKSTSGVAGMIVDQEVFEVNLGDGTVESSTQKVQLSPDLTLGYARIEPFLTNRLAIDLDTKFQVESGVLGAGDLEFNIQDNYRQVKLATILYEETVTERRLLFLENLSLSGLLLPDVQQWTRQGEISARVEGQRLEFQQQVGETVSYYTDLTSSGVSPASDSRIIEARIQVDEISNTDPLGNTGIFFGADVGEIFSSRGVGLQLRLGPDQVVLYSLETGTEVAAFDFAWNDNEAHVYRLVCSADTNTVSVVLDDQVAGVLDFSSFDVSTTSTRSTIGFSNPLTEAKVTWWDYSTVVTPPATAKRTLGVWLGGDLDDIDNWELPRTDSLQVPNSDLSAVIEEMDWRSLLKVRIHRDPAWGVTILRPDLPPPPYFTGDFGPQFTQPSAGWINVEYQNLPGKDSSVNLGLVRFGSLDNRSISQSRIHEVRYRIYKYASEDIIMPNHMVLNQYHVVTSGEYLNDSEVKTVEVLSRTPVEIDLKATHMRADRVFNIQWVNSAGNTVTYYPGSFEFDPGTQVITLTTFFNLGFSPPNDDPVPEDPNVDWPELDVYTDGFNPQDDTDLRNDPITQQYLVKVTYAPGTPITKTYLCSQPLLNGVTLLNEGTPDIVKSQVGKDPIGLSWGSRINDPNDVLNKDPDFILNDPFRYLEAKKDPTIIYEDLEFCEVQEGDTCRISSFCDDTTLGCPGGIDPQGNPGGIGNGLLEMSFSGLLFTEVEPISFTDSPTDAFGNTLSSEFLEASGGDAEPGGNLQEAILFTPLGPDTPPAQSLNGTVGWSVFGQLYDTVTKTTKILYFESKAKN